MATITPYDTAAGKRYRVRYRKPSGAQTDKRGFTTKKAAELFLAGVTVQKATGDYLDPAAGKKTVELFAQQWLHGRLKSLKPSTQMVMETSYRVHVRPVWGARQVSSIRPSEVQDWVGTMIGTGMSAQTARRATFALSSALSIAQRDGILRANPATGLELPAKTKKPKVYLSHRQVQAMAEASTHPTHIYTLAYVGLRWGEAAALRVRHLDLLRNRSNIEENAVRMQGRYVIGTPKDGNARVVPLPPFLIPMIAKLCEGKSRDSFVFGDTEPPPYPHATSGWFTGAVKRAQADDDTFPRITPHDLRHSAASFAVSAGANVKAVQRMLGHSSAAMTLDVYADLFDADLDSVATAINRAREAAIA